MDSDIIMKVIQSEKLLSSLLIIRWHLNGFFTFRISEISKSFTINFGIFIERKNKNVICQLRSFRIEKNFALINGLET